MAVRHPTLRNTLGDLKGSTQSSKLRSESEFSLVTSVSCMCLAVFAGMLLPTQAGLNIQMAQFLGHPLRAACMSFLFGTIGLTCINVLIPKWNTTQPISVGPISSSSSVTSPETNIDSSMEVGNANGTNQSIQVDSITPAMDDQSQHSQQSFDHLDFFEGFRNYFEHLKQSSESPMEYCTVLGGVFGMVYLAMSIYLTPLVGPSVFYISMLLGQLSTSITFDRFGLLWNRTRHLKWLNYGGVLSLFVGVVLFNLDSFGKLSVSLGVFSVSVLLSVLSGISLVVQASLNKRVRHFLGSPFRAAWFSFAVGLSVIAVCALITLGTNPSSTLNNNDHRWYLWFAGFMGMTYVTISIVVPSVIGFAATFTCVVCGNLSLSLTFDATGAFGFPKESVTALKIVGVFLVICAAVLVNLSPDMLASIQGRCSLMTPTKTASDSRK